MVSPIRKIFINNKIEKPFSRRKIYNNFELTKSQLTEWGCKYHELSVGKKPDYDLLICDKTKRIEEI